MASADGPDYWDVTGISAPDVLNIRSKPTWRSDKVGAVEPLDQCLKNINCIRVGKKGTWCKISAYRGNIVGWVNAKYLKEGIRQDCHRFD